MCIKNYIRLYYQQKHLDSGTCE